MIKLIHVCLIVSPTSLVVQQVYFVSNTYQYLHQAVTSTINHVNYSIYVQWTCFFLNTFVPFILCFL